jgi:hypothetical protein
LGRVGDGGGRGGQREPAHFVYFSLGVVGSCSPLPTFSTNKSKTFFYNIDFGVKKSKALLKVAYLKCFFMELPS